MRGDTVQFKIAVVRPHYSSEWVAIMTSSGVYLQSSGETEAEAIVSLLMKAGVLETHNIERVALEQHKARFEGNKEAANGV
jgi:hypothetical protein